MSDFRFANPDVSIGLWVVLAMVVLLLWLENRRGGMLARFLSPAMQSRLVSRPSSTRRAPAARKDRGEKRRERRPCRQVAAVPAEMYRTGSRVSSHWRSASARACA